MAEPSTKPYLIRAIHEWCTDNGFTPYLAVTVDERTIVPPGYARNGEIVLNASVAATNQLRLDNDFVSFQARFNGRAHDIVVPIANISAIYARENGHGMAFEVNKSTAALGPGESGARPALSPGAEQAPRPARGKPTLALAPPPLQSAAESAAQAEPNPTRQADDASSPAPLAAKLPAPVAVLATVQSKPRPPTASESSTSATSAGASNTAASEDASPKPRPATRASRLRASFPSVAEPEASSDRTVEGSAAPVSPMAAPSSASPEKTSSLRRRNTKSADPGPEPSPAAPDPSGPPAQEPPPDGPGGAPKGGAGGRAKLTRIK